MSASSKLYRVTYTDTKAAVRIPSCGGMDSDFSHYESKKRVRYVASNETHVDTFEAIWRAKNSYQIKNLKDLVFEDIGYIQVWQT